MDSHKSVGLGRIEEYVYHSFHLVRKPHLAVEQLP